MRANARHNSFVPLAAALLLAMLSGCSSTFDVLPEKLGGLPADAPERPAERKAFPNVYEVRPTRDATPLSDAEQKKLETDLTTLREEQKRRATPPPPPPPPPPPKAAAGPQKKAPAKVAAPAKKKKDRKST